MRRAPPADAADAGPAKTERVIGVEQGAGVKFVAQTIAQHRLVVLLTLVRDRRRAGTDQADLVMVGQALHLAHSPNKQIPLGLTLPRSQSLGSRQRLGLGLVLGQFLAHFFEVLQRVDFHNEVRVGRSWANQTPRLRIQSAVLKKLAFKRSRSTGSTFNSVMAWFMQASH